MGHREDLLEGAKRCLLEKGYARTTARDIVAASGTNLASIGYHYGSKEALLNQAFLAVTEDWADSLDLPPKGDFAEVWDRVIASFGATRPLWKLQFEIVARLDQDEELQKALAVPQEDARNGLAAMFHGIDPEAEPAKARAAGLVAQALLAGVMVQYLIDPESAPSGQELADGLRVIAGEQE
ncbi:TetR/AcrR family transcriptional regulator [Streptomyces sannanensis]|uniref:TetR/AcrR family transcriptional regulator n=1 Tax=Streptomyces sannanensis TaxID=285536 RepID=A0ABP6SGN3_9ACTN